MEGRVRSLTQRAGASPSTPDSKSQFQFAHPRLCLCPLVTIPKFELPHWESLKQGQEHVMDNESPGPLGQPHLL